MMKSFVAALILLSAILPTTMQAQRMQQPLGRGVVAVYGRSNGSTAVEITWRRLAQEPEDAMYNIYVSAMAESGYTLLNATPLANTNYATTLAKVPYGSYVAVSLIADGIEGERSKPFLFKDNGQRNIYMEISYESSPLDMAKYTTKYVWPCDLNGDGEYDYVVDRIPVYGSRNYYVEGYMADGTFMWNVDLGPNEKPCDGQNDNMCAYDIDCDGHGELIVQTSDGSRFWDAEAQTWGKYVLGSDDADTDGDGIVDYETQTAKNPPRYMSVVDGITGVEKASVEFIYDDAYNRTNKSTLMGDEYNKHEAHIGVFYPDGVHPAITGEWLSRRASDKVHMYRNCAFAYDIDTEGQATNWHQLFNANVGGAEFHMIRIFDADGDGRDEMSSGAYVMDHDGTTLYDTGISHGDRHRTSDIDPERPGLETFAIQQNAPDMLGMILYDATNGTPIKKWYLPAVGDVGRGECIDLDPEHIGWEMFSTMDGYQIYDAKGNKIEGKVGYFPTEGLWWDGQLDRENVNTPDGNGYNAMIVDYKDGRLIEMAKESGWALKSSNGKRGKYWGDIIGDWREELVLIRERDGVCQGIVGFTTDYKTDIDNIYCLQQDPHYRLDCTTRGYYQTPNPGFYLGYGMPRPQLPPCMEGDAETDVYGISEGNATIAPREGVKRVYAMPVKGQALTLSPGHESVTLWKGQQGTLILSGDHDGKVYITEGTVHSASHLRHVELRARGTLAGRLTVDTVVIEGALNYEGCRLMPSGEMRVNKRVVVPETKKLYIQLCPSVDKLVLSQGIDLKGELIFNLADDLTEGEYEIVEGCDIDINKVSANGLRGKSFAFSCEGSTLRLTVNGQREAAEGVVWRGNNSGVWDYQTSNFVLNGEATNFVAGDAVEFDDSAHRTTITINEMMPVTTATFMSNDKEYTLNGTGGISGRTLIKSGKLTVKELNYAFEIDKATIVVNNSNASAEKPLVLNDTATITIVAGTTSLKGKISGNGPLVKAGNGQLNITYGGANSWRATELQAGTLAMGTWNTTFGVANSPVHVTGNSTIVVFDNNSSSQVPAFRNTVTVDRDVTLTYHAGRRCTIAGKLLGEGTYKIDFPYVRGDVSTNCSEFEGTYHVTTSNARFVQAIDLTKATLKLDAGSEVLSVKAGSSTEQDYTHRIGTLTGAGTLGSGTWVVSRVIATARPITVRGRLNLKSATIDVSGILPANVTKDTGVSLFTVNGTVSITDGLTIIPAQPADDLAWDLTTLATDGILRVTPAGAIASPTVEDTGATTIYDLQGRAIDRPSHGIYIIGGKKILH